MLLFEVKIILYLFLNLLSLYTLDYAISIFLKPKIHTHYAIPYIPYFLYSTLGTYACFINNVRYSDFVIQIILVMIIVQNYKGNYKIKLTIAFYWTTFRMIIELLIRAIYRLIFNLELNNLVLTLVSDLIVSISSTLTILAFIKFIYLFQNEKQKLIKTSINASLQTWVIPVCSIAILQLFLKASSVCQVDSYLIILFLIYIGVINSFFFFLFKKLRKAEALKYENKILKNQSEYYIRLEEDINSTFEKVRAIKHDLKYQLLYLKAKTKENTIDALGEADHRLDVLIGEILSESFNEYTRNKKMNRLLNYKLFSIFNNNIEVDIKVNIREDSLFDECNLYIILGNAIDNAITNFNSEEFPDKKIVIRIVDDNNNLYIKITNPYLKKLFYKDGLPLTDKKNKFMHGIGLKNIQKLVEDKNGYLKITTINNIFNLEILLYDEIKY